MPLIILTRNEENLFWFDYDHLRSYLENSTKWKFAGIDFQKGVMTLICPTLNFIEYGESILQIINNTFFVDWRGKQYPLKCFYLRKVWRKNVLFGRGGWVIYYNFKKVVLR